MKRRRIDFAGHPELAANIRMQPLRFEIASRGAAEVALGDVHLHFDEIPLHLRIPFLRRRVLAGSVGPFGVRMRPLEARIVALDAETRGVIGADEAGVDMRLEGACRATLEILEDREGDEEAE